MPAERPDNTVEVVPSDPEWPARFEVVRSALAGIPTDAIVSVEHIGSTAVPELAAKPTIDVLVVVTSIDAFLDILPEVERLGFDHRPDNTLVGSPDHVFLRKVEAGKRTHHLHVVPVGSPEITEYRRFRDALRNDDALRHEYERLKTHLAAAHAEDRMSYVRAKSAWVQRRVDRMT